MNRLNLQGLVAATFTPFDQQGDVNLAAIPPLVEFLLEQKVAGLYVLGSTGEGISLTARERFAVAEAFVAATQHRVPVIVQVGSESLRQSRELAAHAAEIGAEGISAVSPVYFKPDQTQTLVASMAEIAAGGPELPFYYYHIPGATGVSVSAYEFLKAAGERIPNLAGIKFTAPQAHEFQACVEYAPERYEILWGSDEMLLSGLAAGARAAVGSTYNFAAELYHQLWRAFSEGDLITAMKLQSRSQEMVRTFVPYGPRGAQKAMMSMVGPDCGPARLPIPTLSDEQVRKLRGELEGIGFFGLGVRC